MRISTAQIFDAGVSNLNRTQTDLFKLQNQISTGRRVLTPEDDPVAAAQALVTAQSQSVNRLYQENQANARAQLGLLDGQLESLGNLIQDVRERSIQLGNPSLSDVERGFIAEEFDSRFAQLLGIANAQNGEGLYLFSGFQGGTLPFAQVPGAGGPFSAANPVTAFFGDQGTRALQVDAARQIPVNLSGITVFMDALNGNGTFAVSAAGSNTGSGLADVGSVLDGQLWSASLVQPQDFSIRFAVDNTVSPPLTKYNLIDNASGNSMFTNAAPGASSDPDWQLFTPGQAVSFAGLDAAFATSGSLGVQVVLTGTPAAGDRFDLRASAPQSVFDSVRNLADVARDEIPLGAGGRTVFASRVGENLAALDQALDGLLEMRATVGTRLKELDALGEAAADIDLQHTSRLSELQDLDYAAALSDFTRKQVQLEAAQRSFVQTSRLSLFNFL